MSELIENLRVGYPCQLGGCQVKKTESGCICTEAADLIEQLEAENARLKAERDSAQQASFGGADLSRADLREANLRGADLREADLREANLRWADLRGADLRWADLRWADLREADLSGADLREAKGFLLLPVQDPRGYAFTHAVWCDGWRIRAGCRSFTIDEAKKHWGDGYEGDRKQGDLYLYAIDWLEQQPEPGAEEDE